MNITTGEVLRMTQECMDEARKEAANSPLNILRTAKGRKNKEKALFAKKMQNRLKAYAANK